MPSLVMSPCSRDLIVMSLIVKLIGSWFYIVNCQLVSLFFIVIPITFLNLFLFLVTV